MAACGCVDVGVVSWACCGLAGDCVDCASAFCAVEVATVVFVVVLLVALAEAWWDWPGAASSVHALFAMGSADAPWCCPCCAICGAGTELLALETASSEGVAADASAAVPFASWSPIAAVLCAADDKDEGAAMVADVAGVVGVAALAAGEACGVALDMAAEADCAGAAEDAASEAIVADDEASLRQCLRSGRDGVSEASPADASLAEVDDGVAGAGDAAVAFCAVADVCAAIVAMIAAPVILAAPSGS